MAALNVKKGDNVMVITGKDKGTAGEVLKVYPEDNRIVVKGVNEIHKHVKPRKQGETGGVIDAEGALYASKVALFCSKCNKGVRVKMTTDGNEKVRVCAKCGTKL